MQDLYSFSAYRATCFKEKILNKNTVKIEERLSVLPSLDSDKIEFRYTYNNGLTIKNYKKNSNILGEFLALKNDISSLQAFIEKYTYFFSFNKEDNVIHVEDKNIFIWKNRLSAIVEILNILILKNNEPKVDYNILLLNTLFLTLSPYIDFYSDNNKQQHLSSYNIICTEMTTFNDTLDDCTSIDFEDKKIPTFIIPCEITKTGTYNIDIEKYKNFLHENDSNYFNKGLIKAFKNKVKLIKSHSEIDLLIIEFLFILFLDYNIDLSKAITYNGIDFLKIDDFYSKIKDIPKNKLLTTTLNKIAKYLVSEEINRNLSNIKPTYDADTLSPSWQLKDFYSAINLSVFFLNPKYHIIKKCANPYCEAYFQVSPTNRKKIFCCDNCRNNTTQRNYMARKKTRP